MARGHFETLLVRPPQIGQKIINNHKSIDPLESQCPQIVHEDHTVLHLAVNLADAVSNISLLTHAATGGPFITFLKNLCL